MELGKDRMHFFVDEHVDTTNGTSMSNKHSYQVRENLFLSSDTEDVETDLCSMID